MNKAEHLQAMKKIYQEQLQKAELDYYKYRTKWEYSGDKFDLQISNYCAQRYNRLRRLIAECDC